MFSLCLYGGLFREPHTPSKAYTYMDVYYVTPDGDLPMLDARLRVTIIVALGKGLRVSMAKATHVIAVRLCGYRSSCSGPCCSLGCFLSSTTTTPPLPLPCCPSFPPPTSPVPIHDIIVPPLQCVSPLRRSLSLNPNIDAQSPAARNDAREYRLGVIRRA